MGGDRGVRCDRPQWSVKSLGRAFRLANGIFCLFGLANTHNSVFWSGKYPSFGLFGQTKISPYFGLFGLANTRILVCSVWPRLIFRSFRSGQYHSSVCSVCPIPLFCLFGPAKTQIAVFSVWPIPEIRSVPSGQYPYFAMFSLGISYVQPMAFFVCSVWRILIIRFFGLANTQVLVCLVKPKYPHISVFLVWLIPVFWSVRSGQD